MKLFEERAVHENIQTIQRRTPSTDALAAARGFVLEAHDGANAPQSTQNERRRALNGGHDLDARAAPPGKVKFGRPQGRSIGRSVARNVLPMFTSMPRQLLRVTLIRFSICAIRYLWYAMLLRRTRALNVATGDVAPNTVSHNMRGMFDLAVERSLRLIWPLTAIETIRNRIPDVQLLSIGARTEGELYNLYAAGFKKRNVTAVDLISYSPRVRLGDMHALDLPDNSFDATMVGWVLAYSDSKEKAAKEIVRVTKPGGVVAIGSEWHRSSVNEIAAELGYMPASSSRIDSMESLISLFGDNVDHIYFNHDQSWVEPHQELGDFLLLFRVRK